MTGTEPNFARTTVVIPSYRSGRTLPSVLEALGPQVVDGHRAILVKSSSAPGTDEISTQELVGRWPWLEVIDLPERVLPGRARNIGTAATDTELVAFLDDDAVPDTEWLSGLESAVEPGVVAVASAVTNGTPTNRVGTAAYLLEFADWAPEHVGPIMHAPTCGLLVRRDAFERLGGFAEDIWGEDTILTWQLRNEGRLVFAPSSRVRHINRCGLRDFVAHERRLGGAYRGICARIAFPHRWLGRPPWAALAGPLRVAALIAKLRRRPGGWREGVRVAPFLVIGSLWWSIGIFRPPTDSTQ